MPIVILSERQAKECVLLGRKVSKEIKAINGQRTKHG